MSAQYPSRSFRIDNAEAIPPEQLIDATATGRAPGAIGMPAVQVNPVGSPPAPVVNRVISPEETKAAQAAALERVVAEYRRSERRAVWLTSAMVTIPGYPGEHRVSILDLSQEGCLLRSNVPFEPGLDFVIQLVGRRMGTQVKWARGDQAGCQFHRIIELPVFERLVPPQL